MKFIAINKAVDLDHVMGMFSTYGFIATEDTDWILQLPETTELDLSKKHPDSDEFVKACADMYHARKTILRILQAEEDRDPVKYAWHYPEES